MDSLANFLLIGKFQPTVLVKFLLHKITLFHRGGFYFGDQLGCFRLEFGLQVEQERVRLCPGGEHDSMVPTHVFGGGEIRLCSAV